MIDSKYNFIEYISEFIIKSCELRIHNQIFYNNNQFYNNNKIYNNNNNKICK